jgi:hypothetical protein
MQRGHAMYFLLRAAKIPPTIPPMIASRIRENRIVARPPWAIASGDQNAFTFTGTAVWTWSTRA